MPPARKPPQKPPGLLQRLKQALLVPAESAGKTAASARKSDPRQELLRTIRALRARLDPKILKLAEKVARKGPPTTDRERATLAVELFLAQRGDNGQFAEKLRERLQSERNKLH